MSLEEKTAIKKNPLGSEEVLEEAREIAGELAEEMYIDDDDQVVIRLAPGNLQEVILDLRDDDALSYKYLVFITAVDYKDYFEVIYLLRSINHPVRIEIRAVLERENPSIQTISTMYSTACWHERETFDLMGIDFHGHPELTRILTQKPEGVHPLRKDAQPHREERREWHRGMPEPLRLPEEKEEKLS